MGSIIAAAIASGLSVSAKNASAGGTSGVGDVPAVTAVVAGAQGAVTAAWTVIQQDALNPLTITNPTSLTTGFSFGSVQDRQRCNAKVRVTVTSGGQTAFCEITVSYTDRTPLDVGGTL